MACNKIYRLLIVTGLLFTGLNSTAQTFAEWFKQKSTQKKYLLEQIEALQVYTGYLRKGYSVAKGGLGSITGELLKENGLHQTYYNRMRIVAPVVANNGQVKEILRWQQDIIRLFSGIGQLHSLSPTEQKYLAAVKTSVYQDCEGLINTLQQAVSDNKMQMSDADRLKLINRLHGEMQDNYRFAAAFSAQAKTYAGQRQLEANNIQNVKKAYGLD